MYIHDPDSPKALAIDDAQRKIFIALRKGLLPSEALTSSEIEMANYLVNSRDSWNIQEPPDPNGVEKEPFEHLVEKLDAMVLGLVDALDANADDLPQLLDAALSGSLWARRISEQGDQMANAHKFILQARAKLIWRNTTPAVRRSHYAMGVGLDTGLAIDAMAS